MNRIHVKTPPIPHIPTVSHLSISARQSPQTRSASGRARTRPWARSGRAARSARSWPPRTPCRWSPGPATPLPSRREPRGKWWASPVKKVRNSREMMKNLGKRWKKNVEFMSTKLVYLPRYPIMKNQTVSLWLNGKTMGVPVVSG